MIELDILLNKIYLNINEHAYNFFYCIHVIIDNLNKNFYINNFILYFVISI